MRLAIASLQLLQERANETIEVANSMETAEVSKNEGKKGIR
jgi:hypothetical protein